VSAGRGGRGRGAAALAVALALIAPAGCGGGGDNDEIGKLVGDFYAHRARVCDAVTGHFLTRSFGGHGDPRANCRRQASEARADIDYELQSISVSGSRASAAVVAAGEGGRFELLRQDGRWKIDGIKRTAAPSGRRLLSEGQAVRAAVLAWYQAVKKRDESAYCGLLTERFIRSKVGRTDHPSEACLRNARKTLAKLRIAETPPFSKVEIDGSRALVRLADGSELALVKDGDLWKIDGAR
jgi:hypothetical protein